MKSAHDDQGFGIENPFYSRNDRQAGKEIEPRRISGIIYYLLASTNTIDRENTGQYLLPRRTSSCAAAPSARDGESATILFFETVMGTTCGNSPREWLLLGLVTSFLCFGVESHSPKIGLVQCQRYDREYDRQTLHWADCPENSQGSLLLILGRNECLDTNGECLFHGFDWDDCSETRDFSDLEGHSVVLAAPYPAVRLSFDCEAVSPQAGPCANPKLAAVACQEL